MKNLFVFFMCSSFLFSCIKDDIVRPEIDGLRLISFILGPRTTSSETNVIEPIEFKNYRIHVVQGAENLSVLFYDTTTKKLEYTFIDDHHLKVDGLRQIVLEKEELRFMYVEGILIFHLSSKLGSWHSLQGG